MTMLDAMLHRRSVRSYTDDPVSREQIEQILHAGLTSPTGKNLKSWEFVVVTDRDQLARFADGRRGGSMKMLTSAAAAIFVFGAVSASDVWCEDCSAAMANMHLMADSLGLGSCWIQGRLRYAEDGRPTSDFCRELLGVPEGYEMEAVLSIGVPDESAPAPHTLDEADMGKVHWGSFADTSE